LSSPRSSTGSPSEQLRPEHGASSVSGPAAAGAPAVTTRRQQGVAAGPCDAAVTPHHDTVRRATASGCRPARSNR
jgi:hypothetical protein